MQLRLGILAYTVLGITSRQSRTCRPGTVKSVFNKARNLGINGLGSPLRQAAATVGFGTANLVPVIYGTREAPWM